MRFLKIAFIFIIISTTKSSATVFYDHWLSCGRLYNNIVDIYECGRQSRENFFAENNISFSDPRASDGNQYEIFLKSLSLNVQEGKLNNNEAIKVWIDETNYIKRIFAGEELAQQKQLEIEAQRRYQMLGDLRDYFWNYGSR